MDGLGPEQQGLGGTQSQEMDPRQRVALALQMQGRMGKPHPWGQMANQVMQAWNMRRPMPSQAFSGQGANAQQGMPTQALEWQRPTELPAQIAEMFTTGGAPRPLPLRPDTIGGAPRPLPLRPDTIGGEPRQLPLRPDTTGGAPMPLADGDAMMYAGGTPGFDFTGGANPVAPVGLPPVSPIPKLSLGSAPSAGSARTPRTPAY